MKDAILLVVADNREDSEGATNATEIAKKLFLDRLRNKWQVKATNATNMDGLYEGLDWLSTHLRSKFNI